MAVSFSRDVGRRVIQCSCGWALAWNGPEHARGRGWRCVQRQIGNDPTKPSWQQNFAWFWTCPVCLEELRHADLPEVDECVFGGALPPLPEPPGRKAATSVTSGMARALRRGELDDALLETILRLSEVDARLFAIALREASDIITAWRSEGCPINQAYRKVPSGRARGMIWRWNAVVEQLGRPDLALTVGGARPKRLPAHQLTISPSPRSI